ncbi:hypothetical protein K9N08_00010 [Candidatus Gracilibacteria bacterium]|nr:hypothetical protein [Candidatus Gracilibacteria bacterium]MCF7855934.1 hypothetical protein [Candidatus Gracilibacteria bacterium]MCF7896373.1 hypothetical protein [Candidatus Gracilibacteria bacterium]
MGSSSKFHGLTGISSRRIKANVSKRARKNKRNEAKKPNLAAIQTALKSTPEVG